MQATDTPPAWFARGDSKAELLKAKKKWLQFHARKTEGVLSLLPCCVDMPFRVTHNHGHEFKEYGIHNGAQCVRKAWTLDVQDMALLANNTDGEVSLQCLPEKLYVQMETPMKKAYPGLPEKWFPMTPVSTYWNLDADENVDIARRGDPLVPNFSSTIHEATGRTLSSSIGDLGDIGSHPSFQAAMRGCIALSRVRAAHRLLLSQPFSPLLFRQGPQPFPSLLLDVLLGKVTHEQVTDRCCEAQKQCRNIKLLKDQFWTCWVCQKDVSTNRYVSALGAQWYDEIFAKIIQPGRLLCCHKCTTLLMCETCGKSLCAGYFSSSRWINQKRGRNVCLQCESDICHSCALCSEVKGKDGYTETMWQN